MKATQILTENQDNGSPVEQAILQRLLNRNIDLLRNYGLDAVFQAVSDVANFVGDVNEIGTSDVSGWVRQVEQRLKSSPTTTDQNLPEDKNSFGYPSYTVEQLQRMFRNGTWEPMSDLKPNGYLQIRNTTTGGKKTVHVKPESQSSMNEAYSDVSGLLAASALNKSFIVTAELAEGGVKKFRVKAQSERVAREKFSKHHSMAKILDIKEETDQIKENKQSNTEVIDDYVQWNKLVTYINRAVFDDDSEFISDRNGYSVRYKNYLWAQWDKNENQGKITVVGDSLNESLADEFLKMAKEKGMNVRLRGSPEEERARSQEILSQRAREAAARADLAAQEDAAKLPELKSELAAMYQQYKNLGGSGWQFADREQNLTDSERKARDMEPHIQNLEQRIYRAEKISLTEEVTKTRTGLIHKAKKGGYGRQVDVNKPDKPTEKRGRGRPKSGADSQTGKVQDLDTKTLQRWIVGSVPRSHNSAKNQGQRVSAMASVEEAIKKYKKLIKNGKSYAQALKATSEEYNIDPKKLEVYIQGDDDVTEGSDSHTQSHLDAFKSETDTMKPGTKKYVGRKDGKEVYAKKDAQGNVKFYHRDGIKGPLKGVAEGGFDDASPMTKDTVKADRIRSLKNLIAIAKEQGRQLRVQELELELKKLQGVAEGFKNTYNVGDRVDSPLGTGTIVAVSKNVNVDGRVKVKLDDPSKAGEDGKHKDSFVLNTTQLKHIDEQGVMEGAGDYDEFFVAIASEYNENDPFIGMVVREGGRWVEKSVTGTPPRNWGQKYMSYLLPKDVMQWIHKDYGQQAHVAGPFDDEEAANDFVDNYFR